MKVEEAKLTLADEAPDFVRNYFAAAESASQEVVSQSLTMQRPERANNGQKLLAGRSAHRTHSHGIRRKLMREEIWTGKICVR